MSAAQTVPLSSPEKLLWPEAEFTKRDLRDYCLTVAQRLLRAVAGRPLTLLVHPGGVGEPGFFQKNAPRHTPEWIERHRAWTPTSQRWVSYLVARTPADLAWLAGQNAVELHPWFSRVDRPQRPDTLAFDLDPSGDEPAVWQAAQWLREVLDELSLSALVKTSGKRGLHVCVPVQRRYSHAQLRGFGLGIAQAVADRHPDALTTQMRTAKRGDRLLLDWSRAGPAQTLVAAWSPRAVPGGTVSTPLEWDEVGPGLDPRAFTLETALRRPDPWAGPPRPQRIERAREALCALGYACEDRDPRAG